jgi:hypothetical protein
MLISVAVADVTKEMRIDFEETMAHLQWGRQD